jgi:glycosyltransferase involved in cell wall biosynthesis
VRWQWLRYHRRPTLPATAYDIVVGTLVGLWYCLRDGIRLVHARSHVAAVMGWAIQRLLGRPFLFDVRGLLADEYADAGHWSREGLLYRITKRVEKGLLRAAGGVVVLTETLRASLVEGVWGASRRRPVVEVIPCCVDLEAFRADETARASRAARGRDDRLILAYVGKLSVWYMPQQMVEFFLALKRQERSCRLQVWTQSDPAVLTAALAQAGVSASDYAIGFVPSERVPVVLGVADASLCFRKGEASRIGVSPTKFAESLALGLPVVVNRGIGDCDAIIETHQVGVIVQSLDPTGYERAAVQLLEMRRDPSLASRCRRAAEDLFSLEEVGALRYKRIYDALTLPRSPGQ